LKRCATRDTEFGVIWCQHAKGINWEILFSEQRCANRLRQCEITKKVVVHNKKCDANLEDSHA